MSSSIPSFLDHVGQNPELQQKVALLHREAAQTLAEKMAELARSSGFELSAADFLAAQREVSDEELTGVSGGFSIVIPQRVRQEDGSEKIVKKQYN